MNISIIIPNYNGEKLLEKNLPKVIESVKEYKDGKIELIVTDDASVDNSKTIIESFFSRDQDENITCKFLENKDKKKRGFSKNVNRGVKVARGDILILLNSDVIPDKGFLTPLLSHFNDPSVFAVGCMDESVEGDEIILRGRGIGKWKRGFLMHGKGDIGKKMTTLWVSGGSGAFRKTIWDRLGGLDAIYDPFYWEDIDLSYRALKAGYQTLFESKSIVRHEHEKGVIKMTFKPFFIRCIAYRNQFIFVWKNISQGNLLLSHIVWLPYHFLKALFRFDFAFFKGFYLAFSKIPTVRRSRKQAKKYFIRKDSTILRVHSV